MPIYVFACAKGHRFDRYLKLAEYDTPQRCECGESAVRQVVAPMVMPDIPAYQSPVTGQWVNSRAQRREDLRRHDCVEYEPSMKDHALRQRAQEDAALEASVEQTVEREIALMPTRKREKLAAEMDAGVDVELTRI
jgi:putative FmdB family regulatory protein